MCSAFAIAAAGRVGLVRSCLRVELVRERLLLVLEEVVDSRLTCTRALILWFPHGVHVQCIVRAERSTAMRAGGLEERGGEGRRTVDIVEASALRLEDVPHVPPAGAELSVSLSACSGQMR